MDYIEANLKKNQNLEENDLKPEVLKETTILAINIMIFL